MLQTPATNIGQLPPEMLDFTILKSTGSLAPRLGRLSLPGRKTVLTPAFIGNTSRGAIPHISQDNFRKCGGLEGVYIPLEDFIEKHPQKTPPIFKIEARDPLRKFIALPNDTFTVLGARRSPPISTPVAHTNTEISLLTSVGFRSMTSEYYAAAACKLQPDIVVGLADIPFGQEVVGTKRKDKMSDRTEMWLRDIIAKKNGMGEEERKFNIFAPILPIERDLQSWYLEHLLDDMVDKISGVAIYDAYLLDDLPDELHHLPRLSFHVPASPQELLRQVSLGMDLFTIPFINFASDAGIALDFTFPPPAKIGDSPRQALGIDMWDPELAVSVTPISGGCTCNACTKHHRAYIQHLLSAKEMLGWVLIQIHNHAVLDSFFTSIRASIEAGTFDADVATFSAFYEPQLPDKTGQGPRVRGYQFKSEEHGKSGKKNPKAYKKFDEEKIVQLRAAHGQNKAVRDLVDDEALVGLVGMTDMEGVKLDGVALGEDEVKA
ncbi:tRNA-guanine transglycosylase [Massarina eburnea CBS 473.64]|uniref:Queuine tRNA-ribosyltransferase accessory subunit 2 n=1 Tax=Massarina eburnea CBS 473.64 TaxID=1395130 RepID=A0A6A6SGT2_9PLEO|nr:tRNA-guanine transglycosylase [Massarina eburnea CBS 473.64]